MTPRKNKQTQFNACITGVNPIRSHGLGVYRGRRRVWGVRVDEKLLKQAKPLIRAQYGSDCRAVESFLAGVVATHSGKQLVGVNPSHTSIGVIKIERNLRSRRKLEVEETEVTETKTIGLFCSVGECSQTAKFIAVLPEGQEIVDSKNDGTEPQDFIYYCKSHLAKAKRFGNLKSWKPLEGP